MNPFRFATVQLAAGIMLGGIAQAFPFVWTQSPASPHIVLVGQPSPGRPVQLHGILGRVDAANRTVSIVRLSGMDFYWNDTTRLCAVYPGVDLSGLRPGMSVLVTLSQDAARRYIVSAISPE